MRLAGLGWLVRHASEFGYSHGAMKGGIGTAAVLLGAVVVALSLRRFRVAGPVAAGAFLLGGIAWLATH